MAVVVGEMLQDCSLACVPVQSRPGLGSHYVHWWIIRREFRGYLVRLMLLRQCKEQQNVETRGNINRKRRRGGLLVADFELSGARLRVMRWWG